MNIRKKAAVIKTVNLKYTILHTNDCSHQNGHGCAPCMIYS